jgi:hypothetical protein
LRACACLCLLLAAAPAAVGQPQEGFGREIPLTGLWEPGCVDVYETAVQHALVRLNYHPADRESPDRTEGWTRHDYLVRPAGAEPDRLLLIGLKCYGTQDSRIYLWGTVGSGQDLAPNPDLQPLADVVQQTAEALKASPRTFSVRELSHETYELSCIDVESCIEVLGVLGYNTAAPQGEVSLDTLPAVFPVPFKASEGVVGRSAYNADQEAQNAALPGPTLSAPHSRLMVLYHPTQSAAVARLKELLTETVDVPDRQVLIEGMVIELTEDDFKELGAQWEYFGQDWLKITFLNADDNTPFIISYNPEFTPAEALQDRLRATIRAVIQEGRAEVLSSPSVLVLNNRNARIKVVRDTPILSTKVTFDIQNVDVRFEPVGIVLNIRPRISQDDSAVTMQIVAEVSEIPPGEAISVAGTVVAPAIDRRVVETVARVHNNTPFIIGGLIRNEETREVDRIPILSRIPLLGAFFRRSVTTREKREVIIVLTPRVIPTAGRHRPLLPKDTARFDFLDNRLFRNTYRIKAEDVFDLGFLERNETILEAFSKARALVARHPEYAARPPINHLAEGAIPGEDAVVIRMLYEIAKDKLSLHEQIGTESIIYFEKAEGSPAGFEVEWLWKKLRQVAPEELKGAGMKRTLQYYFGRRDYPRKALLVSYDAERRGGLEAALQAPVATAEWVMVADPDKPATGLIPRPQDLMLSANALAEEGYDYEQHAFILDTESDLRRVKLALALREVAKVNDFGGLPVLREFRVGRRIAIPELAGEDERMFLLDAQAAFIFYKSDYYYSDLKARLERGYEMLEEALAREGM